MSEPSHLLIYAPVPLYASGDGYLLEDQACNGLRLWAENFDKVTVMMPVQSGTPPANWQPLENVGENLARIEVIPLPEAYRIDRFLRHLPTVRSTIRAAIEKADYLSFSIGGLWGDWGSVACLLAHGMGRPFAVWTDRVESEVVRRTARDGRGRHRVKAQLAHRPMAMYERFIIRRATLGLFHGKETFDTYAPYCRQPVIVHDIHIHKSEHISSAVLNAKTDGAAAGPLKIGYVGRADAMKGPMDWIAALEGLAEDGVDFEAFWMGEGPYTERMQTQIESKGLADRIRLLGFVRDRDEVLSRFREAQVFMFTHKTPESPRCLIEALISGTPIVGYDGAFARDLISDHGGGRLVPLNDVPALTETLSALAADRGQLAGMIGAAVQDGAPYDDESVFHHRSEVIRQHLSRQNG